jgi:hypothetical protein
MALALCSVCMILWWNSTSLLTQERGEGFESGGGGGSAWKNPRARILHSKNEKNRGGSSSSIAYAVMIQIWDVHFF